jgi:hypothetical protein
VKKQMMKTINLFKKIPQTSDPSKSGLRAWVRLLRDSSTFLFCSNSSLDAEVMMAYKPIMAPFFEIAGLEETEVPGQRKC